MQVWDHQLYQKTGFDIVVSLWILLNSLNAFFWDRNLWRIEILELYEILKSSKFTIKEPAQEPLSYYSCKFDVRNFVKIVTLVQLFSRELFKIFKSTSGQLLLKFLSFILFLFFKFISIKFLELFTQTITKQLLSKS